MRLRIKCSTSHKIELLLLCNKMLKSIEYVSKGSFVGKRLPV